MIDNQPFVINFGCIYIHIPMKLFLFFRSCLLPLAGLLFCCACEKFEPEGEYFKEIKVKEPGLLQIKLNPATDTLMARGDAFFSFEVPEHVREGLGYRLFLGSELLEENPYPPDMVLFEAGTRQDGYYKLRLELYVKSNTGSLADKVGMEHFVYEYAWVLKVDNRPSSAYPIHEFKVTEEAGRIKLSWPEYDIPKFGSYAIYKREVGGLGRYRSIFILDPKETHYYDDAFVGGSYTYSLEVRLDEYPSYVSGNPQEIRASFPHLKKQEPGEESFYVAWSSCLYPENFVAYEIYRQDPSGTKMIFSSTNIEDTTAVLPANFGTLSYQLHTRGKGIAEEMEGPISDFTLSYGRPHSLPAIPAFLVGEKAYLLSSDDGRLTKYDGADLEPLLSRPYSGYGLTNSDNGEYIYYCDGSHFVRLNPANLEELERISVESLIGYGNRPQHFSVNNQNQLLFTGHKTSDWKTDSMTLVDMNRKLVLKRRYDPQLYPGKLSNDGHYFLQWYTTLIDLEHEERNLLEFTAQWLPKSTPQLLYNTDRSIVVMEPENRQVLKEIPTPGLLHDLTVDPLTGYIGGVLYREGLTFYRIYNVETGELLREIEVNTPYISFRNSTLFTTDSYMPLSLP